MVPVAIALGSNLGDRAGYLRRAIDALGAFLRDLRVSEFHDTEPVGVGRQPSFLNAALTGLTSLDAQSLLAQLLEIEAQLGRTRPFAGAPRTIDIDLILYGDHTVHTATLTVPHPRFRERRFVLQPLVEVASSWVDPTTGATIKDLYERCLHSPDESTPPET